MGMATAASEPLIHWAGRSGGTKRLGIRRNLKFPLPIRFMTTAEENDLLQNVLRVMNTAAALSGLEVFGRRDYGSEVTCKGHAGETIAGIEYVFTMLVRKPGSTEQQWIEARLIERDGTW